MITLNERDVDLIRVAATRNRSEMFQWLDEQTIQVELGVGMVAKHNIATRARGCRYGNLA